MELGTATLLKDVSEFFTGSAGLYQLAPPFRRDDIDPNGVPYTEVVEYVVAADALIGGIPIGTTLYQCDETGYVTSWERMHEKPMTTTRSAALMALGYEERKADGR
jgi:hypothetical protein